jgi:hypothetical protein
MQSVIEEIEDQLVGIWVPTFNRVPPERAWPRLVFVGGRGYFEDGDYPAIYSVERFEYRLIASTVLEITQADQEYLDDAGAATVVGESWIVPRYYDFLLHSFAQGEFLDLELSPGSPRVTQYYKFDVVTSDYAPYWSIA